MIKKFFSLIIGFSILSVIYLRLDVSVLLDFLYKANKKLVFISLVLLMFTQVLSAIRWKKLINRESNISYLESLKIILATSCFNLILPSKAGDLLKAITLRNKVSRKKSIMYVLYEKSLDFSSLLLLMSFSFFFVGLNQLDILLGGIALIFLLFFSLIHFRWNIDFSNQTLLLLKDYNQFSFKLINTNLKNWFTIIFVSLFTWSLHVLQFYLIFIALGVNISHTHFLIKMPQAIFIGIIPITFAGLGTRDAFILYSFSEINDPEVLALVGMFAFSRYVILAVIGFPFLSKNYLKVNQDDYYE